MVNMQGFMTAEVVLSVYDATAVEAAGITLPLPDEVIQNDEGGARYYIYDPHRLNTLADLASRALKVALDTEGADLTGSDIDPQYLGVARGRLSILSGMLEGMKKGRDEAMSHAKSPTYHSLVQERMPDTVLEQIALVLSEQKRLQVEAQALVDEAREQGVTWARIAKVASVKPQSAYQRWSETGRTKHATYQRRRRGAV